MARTVSFADDMVVVYTIPRIESSAVKKDLFYARSDFQRFKKEEKQRENRVMLQQIHRGLHPAATYEDKMLAKELLTMLEMRAGPENRADLLKSIALAIARFARQQTCEQKETTQESLRRTVIENPNSDKMPTLPTRWCEEESRDSHDVVMQYGDEAITSVGHQDSTSNAATGSILKNQQGSSNESSVQSKDATEKFKPAIVARASAFRPKLYMALKQDSLQQLETKDTSTNSIQQLVNRCATKSLGCKLPEKSFLFRPTFISVSKASR